MAQSPYGSDNPIHRSPEMPRLLPAFCPDAKRRPPFVLLEDRLDLSAPALLYADPVAVVRCDAVEDVAAALVEIEAGLARGLHAAGFLSYELGYAFEPKLAPLMPAARSVPLLWFGLFRAPTQIPAAALDQFFGTLAPPPPIGGVQPSLDSAGHASKVRRILDYLAAGDAYQINLTFPVGFHYEGDPLALYAAMRSSQPVSHGGVVAFAGATVLSVSPELFLDVAAGRVTTRPMKGTVARGADAEADRAAIAGLSGDPKQRAENLMIVDLLRNDLGRIAELGSVKVPALFSVETYPTLHTLTSTVMAKLRKGLSLNDLLQAVFPCGSITGAPKHRAMELIREIETEPRDVYTGSIGAFAPNGDLRLNVAIRTATIFPDGEGRYGVGGGIVADSEAQSEYDECLLKARVLTDLSAEYGLIETLRWSQATGFARLALHLDRLGASAGALGFRFDPAAMAAELEQLAGSFISEGDRRVRLELHRSGKFDLTAAILGEEPDRPLLVAVAPERVDAGDPFLRHKTTRRARYEFAFAAATANGRDEVIFLNRAGRVTEAARSNVFVERGGRLLTPPLANGLLPGVLRRALLESGEVVEQELSLDDLRMAERWFLGNSLRGLRLARL
ncbi:para-aminobenzoate synthetase / 4-amino-4-deoxychorismate lyase [Bosea lathyri]|uniref:Probable branched-chain-amino-acid aminotransferase n=2 Tax=Bosea lathyri TaxID=1036778 RepID=A0A1H5YPV9_9HYPH|nr:para-aminobenzoate synthetase / 4-amino-4-deoxychorismate lyase [Bosea lathyri]